MRYAFLALTVCVAFALAQTPGAPKAAPKAAPKTAPGGATKTPAKAAAKGPNVMDPSTMKASAPAVYVVRLETTKGPIEIRVTKAWAPLGADRFYNLVRAGFYTDAAFFRTIKGFMAQFGIPARPEVNRVWDHMNLKDDPVLQSNKRGFVTFATGGPNTRTTQIFIGMRDNGYLDADGFSPFGEVIEGMDVVDMLYNGYGDAASLHPGIDTQGKAFLDKNFPKLDRILKASIVPPAPATPPATPTKAK
jgi:peptidyl-prolyl cis-trans isomerase A (cyclophilin A)